MSRIAAWVHRNTPVRLMSTTVFHCSNVRSSIGIPGAPVPALLKRRSRRPKRSLTRSNSACTEAGLPTSVATASAREPASPASRTASASASARRPASATA
jgi:hypothetical protein